jgi:endonuclease YncB( thermonuclease family)
MWLLAALLSVLFNGPSWATNAVVTDADTIRLGDTRFRLDGIDAPERDQMCLDEKGDPWACGSIAREVLSKLIENRPVRCEDVGADTVYGRRIGICTVEGEKESVNTFLVRQGMAINFEPYARGRFKSAEADARDRRLGLWTGCFVNPRDFRNWNKQSASLMGTCDSAKGLEIRDYLFPDDPSMPLGCSIKGKLSARADATSYHGIYHLAGCRSYARLIKPNRWFCSEQEAQDAGFRKALTCPPSSHAK